MACVPCIIIIMGAAGAARGKIRGFQAAHAEDPKLGTIGYEADTAALVAAGIAAESELIADQQAIANISPMVQLDENSTTEQVVTVLLERVEALDQIAGQGARADSETAFGHLEAVSSLFGALNSSLYL